MQTARATTGSGADGWSQAIKDSMGPDENTPAKIAARRAVAQKFDWVRLAGEVARAFAERLGSPYSDRFSDRSAPAESSRSAIKV